MTGISLSPNSPSDSKIAATRDSPQWSLFFTYEKLGDYAKAINQVESP